MTDITCFLSPISPYVYLAGTRPAEVAAKHGLGIDYRPLDVQALFARTGGTPLAQRHPSRQAYRLADLKRSAKAAGMPINAQPAFFPTNPAPAAYAIIAAQKAGGGDVTRLVTSISRACWAEERDIADDTVIRDCLGAAGFDPGLADSGLLSGAESYERNLEDAVAAGAFGVPFLVAPDGAGFWGADRIDHLDRHLAGDL